LFGFQPRLDDSAGKTGRNALGINDAVQASHPRRRRERPRAGAFHFTEKYDMNLTIISVGPLVALIAGILILIMPRLLNYIVAIYLIIIGVLGLAAYF